MVNYLVVNYLLKDLLKVVDQTRPPLRYFPLMSVPGVNADRLKLGLQRTCPVSRPINCVPLDGHQGCRGSFPPY
jgi:hypothetical protein